MKQRQLALSQIHKGKTLNLILKSTKLLKPLTIICSRDSKRMLLKQATHQQASKTDHNWSGNDYHKTYGNTKVKFNSTFIVLKLIQKFLKIMSKICCWDTEFEPKFAFPNNFPGENWLSRWVSACQKIPSFLV